MNRSIAIAVTVFALMPVASAQAQMRPNTQRGATVGGIAGAIAGGIIGENNDEAGAGALIGGAIGALAGGAIGNARDKEMEYQAAQQRYQAQQRYYAVEQQRAVAVQQAVSNADVIAMSRSGLSDAIVVNQIMERGVQRRPEVSDIIQLHQNGVSEQVISAMQRATVGTPAPAPAPVIVQPSPQTIYVERPVQVVPTYVVPAPRYYQPPYHHHHRRGSSWGFSMGF